MALLHVGLVVLSLSHGIPSESILIVALLSSLGADLGFQSANSMAQLPRAALQTFLIGSKDLRQIGLSQAKFCLRGPLRSWRNDLQLHLRLEELQLYKEAARLGPADSSLSPSSIREGALNYDLNPHMMRGRLLWLISTCISISIHVYILGAWGCLTPGNRALDDDGGALLGASMWGFPKIRAPFWEPLYMCVYIYVYIHTYMWGFPKFRAPFWKS